MHPQAQYIVGDDVMDYRENALKMIQAGEATRDWQALRDAFDMVRCLELEGAMEVDGVLIHNRANFEAAHEIVKQIRSLSAKAVLKGGGGAMLDLNRKCLLFDAPYDFDAYCRYIESNRPKEKRFYEPRRKGLKVVVDAMQRLADDELDLLGVSMPPGTGKSTIAIFFLCWMAGKNPEKPILGGSHSNSFLRGVYDECLRIMDPQGEYLWCDVFPGVNIVDTNAKDMRIDLKEPKRFQTLEFSSVGSNNAGKVRCEQLLYVDDLVSGIEQAMSRERLDKLWEQFVVDLLQRRIGNCKTLIIATRWSVHDPLGRLEQSNEDNPRAQFIRIPALNEDGESNFDYENSVGFTTNFYRQQREIMDDVSWQAIYQQNAIERHGLVFEAERLRRYFKLPEQEPDAIIAVCDTKEQGNDYCVMPVAYQYGRDYYIDTIICDNGKVDAIEARIAQTLVDLGVQRCRIESNRGGTLFAQEVERLVTEKGGTTAITTKWTQSNKQTRIEISSAVALARFLFKDESVYRKDKEYRTAMDMLTSYSSVGRVAHDDVPDAIAMLVDFINSFVSNKVSVVKRMF
jgi:predicted phage terminase large subunit-like protein